MSSCRVAQVGVAGGEFEVVEREVQQPGPGHVRIAAEACGICHSDTFFVDAGVPAVSFPLVTGDEIAGRIDALGEGTSDRGWQVGDRGPSAGSAAAAATAPLAGRATSSSART